MEVLVWIGAALAAILIIGCIAYVEFKRGERSGARKAAAQLTDDFLPDDPISDELKKVIAQLRQADDRDAILQLLPAFRNEFGHMCLNSGFRRGHDTHVPDHHKRMVISYDDLEWLQWTSHWGFIYLMKAGSPSYESARQALASAEALDRLEHEVQGIGDHRELSVARRTLIAERWPVRK